MRGQTNGDAAQNAVAVTFFVGRDGEGHWLAIEGHGRGGGIFIDREAAMHYALTETCRRPGAVVLKDEPIVLLGFRADFGCATRRHVNMISIAANPEKSTRTI